MLMAEQRRHALGRARKIKEGPRLRTSVIDTGALRSEKHEATSPGAPNQSRLVIEQFNPYSDQYPNRRVISRKELELFKLLRAEGLDIEVSGDPSHELNYLSRKGVQEWLSDPVIVQLVGIPVSIICGVISTLLYNKFAGGKLDHTDVVLELDNHGNRGHYRCDGTPLDTPEFNALLKAMQERRAVYPNITLLRSPYPTRPIPLFLEHTSQVVGWGTVVADDDIRGMRVEDALITDAEVWRRIKEGQLKGFSIALLVKEARCEVCGESYFECGHIAGQFYNGISCVVRLMKFDMCEISVVANPVNPNCTLYWKGAGN
jgi:hypothetical protein